MKSLVLFPYAFVLMNWAAVVGLYRFLRGQDDVWSGYDVVDSPPNTRRLREAPGRHDDKFSDAA